MSIESAQDMMDMMKVEPGKEHQWLQRAVGEWSYKGECCMGPDQPKSTMSGTETTRSVGGLWIVQETRGECPMTKQSVTTIITLGYDPAKSSFTGACIVSMMTHLWYYDSGELDASGQKLTLNTEGPDVTTPGKMRRFRDIIEFKSDDLRHMRSELQGDDGEWHEIMRAEYRRTK